MSELSRRSVLRGSAGLHGLPSPRLRTCRLRLPRMQLQQGLAASEMGLMAEVAQAAILNPGRLINGMVRPCSGPASDSRSPGLRPRYPR
jgi:hypothetical protein